MTDNGNEATPRRSEAWDIGFGGGIVVAGGNDNVIVRNRVEDNSFAGIALSVFFDENFWLAERNRVEDNVVSGSPYDLLMLMPGNEDGTYDPHGNCFAGNTFTTSLPADIEANAPCDGDATAAPDNGMTNTGGPFGTVDHTEMAAPGPQPSMPDADTAPARPAGMPADVDTDAVTVPDAG